MSWNIADKTVLITGATSGIGKAAATQLASLGASVILTARNIKKGEDVLAEIRAASGSKKLELLALDLSSQESIRAAATEFKKRHSKLDVLINNAGVNLFTRETTKEGYEATFATNVLGPFLLTNLLLDSLKASGSGRIVNVVSSAQMQPDLADLMAAKHYSPFPAYAKSKTALIFLTYELDRRLKGSGVVVNCLHPGVVRTELARDAKGFARFVFSIALRFFSTPDEGAENSVYLASSPEVEGVSGKYFVKHAPAPSAKYTYDEAFAKQLWQMCEQWTAVS